MSAKIGNAVPKFNIPYLRRLNQNLLQSCYAGPGLYASNAVKLRVDSSEAGD